MNNKIYNNNLFRLVDICPPNEEKNIVISGISIKMALAMLLNGAEGQSKVELASFIGNDEQKLNEETLALLSECQENIKLVNAFWFTTPNQVNEKFSQIIKKYQNAEINVDDFSSPDTLEKINEWISHNTNGLINKAIDDISGATSLLINTLYFKAQWAIPFKEYLTHDEMFYGTEKNSNVQMMKTYAKMYLENDLSKAISLRYENMPYEFVAILPNKEGEFKIEELDINNLNAREGNYNVNIDFPKIDVGYDVQLESVLKSVGIVSPFVDSNDFSSMLSIPQKISKIIHKTKFKLDEKGTEAAAATIIEMVRGMNIPLEKPIEINLKYNRPFAFIIRHIKTKDLLFVGKINNL